MKCEEARLAISDRLDGALEPAIAPKLHEHLQGCEPCRVEEDAFLRLDAALASAPHPPIPSGLVKSLMRSVQPPSPPSISKGRLALWGLAAAGAIALTVLLLHAYSKSLETDPAPPAASAKPAKGARGKAHAPVEPPPVEDPVQAETPARPKKHVPIIDSTAFEALELLKERVAARPGRGDVLDVLDRAGLFLEVAGGESEAESPDFSSSREGIATAGAIGTVQALAGEFDRAGDMEAKKAARDLLVALRSVVDA
jgi:anti-sigma factor RsiW